MSYQETWSNMASTQQLLLGEGAGSGEKNYIEDVFSTYLYTGNGSTQTITNNIDLSTKGGLVWIKNRQSGSAANVLFDTARGAKKRLISESTGAEYTYASTSLTAFGSSGFTVVDDTAGSDNVNGAPGGTYAGTNGLYASWTFRKQPKFFDIQTWTGNDVNGRTISHSLGSTPGCIIIKNTTSATSWVVSHRSIAAPETLKLNTTDAKNNYDNGVTSITSTSFNVSSDVGSNASGSTYVAYIFAHDAGGFGLTGTDNVISCGSFTTDSSGNASVNLGWEPQWVLTKMSTAATQWVINDNMRGMPASQTSQVLYPSLSAAESSSIYYTTQPNAMGFTTQNYAGQPNNTVIYIAIRRGPMKVPTDATKVFAPVTSSATTGTITSGFPTDLVLSLDRTTGSTNFNRMAQDRLRGAFNILDTSATTYEFANTSTASFASNTGVILNGGSVYSNGFVHQQFRRAPSFFDEVCYTGVGNGTAQTVPHNLAAVPEMMILKKRSSTASWPVYHKDLGNTSLVYLDLNNAVFGPGYGHFGSTTPTASNFYLQGSNEANESGATFVAYLFATCPGISKVGSYTGTGTTKQVDCGFTSGARFVLIKKTSGTGSWYVWDTARGIVSGNDPYLLLNSTAAEVTSTDYIDAYSAGFELSSSAPGELNASGATYIFLAIA